MVRKVYLFVHHPEAQFYAVHTTTAKLLDELWNLAALITHPTTGMRDFHQKIAKHQTEDKDAMYWGWHRAMVCIALLPPSSDAWTSDACLNEINDAVILSWP